MRLRIRYLDDLLMPKEEYSTLLDILLDSELTAVKALADRCHAERTPLAAALLRVFRSDSLNVSLDCFRDDCCVLVEKQKDKSIK